MEDPTQRNFQTKYKRESLWLWVRQRYPAYSMKGTVHK